MYFINWNQIFLNLVNSLFYKSYSYFVMKFLLFRDKTLLWNILLWLKDLELHHDQIYDRISWWIQQPTTTTTYKRKETIMIIPMWALQEIYTLENVIPTDESVFVFITHKTTAAMASAWSSPCSSQDAIASEPEPTPTNVSFFYKWCLVTF